MIPADDRGRGGTRGSGWTCIAADFRLQNLRLTYDKVICFVVSELVGEEKAGKPAWWCTRCAYTAARTCNRAVSILICDFRFGALHGGGGARGGAQLNVSAAVCLRILQCGASEIEKRRDVSLNAGQVL